MATIHIQREKSMLGMAAPMKCYISNNIICEVKNGQKVSCEVKNEIISFNCNMLSNPKSDTLQLDLSDGKTITISIKQTITKPVIHVDNEDAIVRVTSAAISAKTSAQTTKTTSTDLQSALRGMIKETKTAVAPNQSYAVLHAYNDIVFTPTKEVGDYFAIDEHSKLWRVGKNSYFSTKNTPIYHWNDIVDFELIEDGDSVIKGGVGSVIVGGLLFGGLGAIVGSNTGKRKIKQTCTSLMIKITIKDTATPMEYIKLISSPISKSNLIYKTAYKDAQEIISLLQIICQQIQTSSPNENISNDLTSPVEEIKKAKKLMDNGIITPEEFQLLKKKLVSQ